MSFSINNPNFDNTILDAAKVKDNMTYILKFGLFSSVAQHNNFWFIFNDIHIDDLVIALDIKLNSYIFNCLKSYQLSPTLVIYKMLEVFCNFFY